MTGNDQLAPLFLETTRHSLVEDHWPRLRACVASLTEEQLWWRPNDSSNSIGNLLLHLDGNLRQWIVATFHRVEANRNRSHEFAERGPIPAAGLLARLASTIEEAAAVLARLTPEDLAGAFQIQGYTVSGLHAIYHSVEHFAMHYGQIAYIAKLLQNRDLGFFRHLEPGGSAQ